MLTRARLGDEAWNKAAPPRVLVTGMGPIGFAAVLSAVARGWPVTMLGRDKNDSFRAKLVERLGGCYLPIEEVGSGVGDVERDGFDLLLECTGSDSVLLHASSVVRSCGVIVWLGTIALQRRECTMWKSWFARDCFAITSMWGASTRPRRLSRCPSPSTAARERPPQGAVGADHRSRPAGRIAVAL